jgi:DNA polymerase I-like protein with 3'-5' exonuclease and polymerase domains
MKVKNSDLNNLFLLPKNFPKIEDFPEQIKLLQEKAAIYVKLMALEQEIQPILQKIESTGIEIANDWFDVGLHEQRANLMKIQSEIDSYFPNRSSPVDDSLIESFFLEKQLPLAKSFDHLQQYIGLHPLYGLLLQKKKNQQFINQWGERLFERGSPVKDGILLQGHWLSYASYTGRIFAKKLPLTSLPKRMRNYIQAPRTVISLDFNNAELRFLAYYSRCTRLLEQFENGEDIHYQTGTMIAQEIGLNDAGMAVIRKIGKQFAFALLYGAGTSTITNKLRKQVPTVTSATVSNLISAFFNTYPEAYLFLDNLEKDSHLLTPFGRIKPLATFKPTQKRNYPFQSSIAVAVKQLMVIAIRQLEIVHVIHDEIWVLAPTREPTVVDEVIEDFYQQLIVMLPGFPISGFIKVEQMGGKTHEHG